VEIRFVETQDELFDEASLRSAWRTAGFDVTSWDIESALAEARRLAVVVARLRTLDDGLLTGQLKSTAPEDLDAILRVLQ